MDGGKRKASIQESGTIFQIGIGLSPPFNGGLAQLSGSTPVAEAAGDESTVRLEASALHEGARILSSATVGAGELCACA